ncbi:MAG TPA: SprT-like domain-containing protein [Flavipsychrobacter sp.]|nr:SprT-like domain-containing protein [Flavipsychrobacter sp.]
MKKQETSINLLEQFLPPDTFEQVAPFFKSHTIHLTLTHERKSVLGDYRHPIKETPYHRISINVNLNPYSFLITLLHELAHLLTFIHFKNTVSPHGKEWKTQFRHILIPFIGKHIFPLDVEKALLAYLHDPAASTCTDPHLFKALYQYDEHKPGFKLIDDIGVNQHFETEDGRVFQKIEQLRTRSRCRDLKNGKFYFFQGIIEVKAVRKIKQ